MTRSLSIHVDCAPRVQGFIVVSKLHGFVAARSHIPITSYRKVAMLRRSASRVMREFSNKFLTCRQANLASQEPLLIVPVEDSLLDVGPKFLESIDHHASGETFCRAEKCVLHIGFAMNAPGIR